MNGLHIEKLSAAARGKKYLDKISLDVDCGEAFALIGRGGDRRLLLRIARECTQEKIKLIENEDVMARIDSGDSTLVIEGDNLFGFMTVCQYLMYCVGAIRLTKIEKLDRITANLELVGLEDKWKNKVCTLSRTEQCLLSIANGMFLRPEVLLLCLEDLKFSKESADRLNDAITRIKSLNVAVVATVNDSRLIQDGFDRIGLMTDGRLIEQGSCEDIISKYSYCVYSVKTDADNIKKLSDKFSQLRSVVRVMPRGEKIYLYTLDREKTGREMLEALGENKIEELRMISPSLKDALTRANARAAK